MVAETGEIFWMSLIPSGMALATDVDSPPLKFMDAGPTGEMVAEGENVPSSWMALSWE
jgi:hypothetical protein